MKKENKIRENLIQKIAGYKCGYGGDRIKEHIIMLDWVLNDGFVRDIDEIIKDYEKRIEEFGGRR